jgi:predicted DNA-binding transcriptional regulator AlpA
VLRAKDLKERGITQSHTGLRYLQIHHGFPLGILLGPSTRAWPEPEVAAWLASRPTEQTKARAVKSVEARRPTARQMLDRGAA